MANQTYSIKFDAEAGPLVSGLSKVEKATAKVSKAQDTLNKIALSSAAAESPLAAIRLKSAQDLARLNKLYESGSISMKQYNTAVNQVISRQKAQIASMQSVSGGMRSMRGAMGQLGYQVQDVAVQLQMGQNAMLVFAQQGSQIASVFGPGGAVVGAVIALAGAIGMSLMPELKEAKKELGELSNEALEAAGSLEALTQAQREATIIEKEREIAEALKQQKKLRKELAEEEAKLNAKPKPGVLGFSVADVVPEESRNRVKAIKQEMTLLTSQIDTLKQNTEKLNQELENFKELNDEGAKAADLALKKELEAEEAKNQALMIRGENLRKAQEYTQKIAQEDFQFTQDWIRDQIEFEYDAKMEAEKKLQEDVRALRSLGLDNQKRDLQGNFVEQLRLIDEFEKSKSNIEFDAAKAREQVNENMQKSAIAQFTNGMEALGAYNKKAFRITKAAKTAEALMNTYAGVTQALSHYPPPISYIAAAGQLAFGMAQVAQIKSQTFAGRAAGGMVQAGQPYMVGEMGKEMFIPSTSGRIANNNEVEGGMGTTNINFSITTVDARGFDELLNSRRGQIVSMVNRAMHDKGRVGVTA